jgi:hypothetical protein
MGGFGVLNQLRKPQLRTESCAVAKKCRFAGTTQTPQLRTYYVGDTRTLCVRVSPT